METVLVFLWGALGGLCRYSLTNLIDYHTFPIVTLLINLTGAFFLPLWTDYLCQKIYLSKKFNREFGTGFIGSFTTFSGMILDAFKLIQAHQYQFLLLYLGISMVGGVILAIIGDSLAHYLLAKDEVL
ncbi:fluoride efflux transporter FluC [Fructilactobacillus frigidiflavus]|uniref:fluoride efflux transporter FluC n=1 Tax=Fructilactobacillus frigidiflavus TaxID=3242688 RepID=UPI003756E10D